MASRPRPFVVFLALSAGLALAAVAEAQASAPQTSRSERGSATRSPTVPSRSSSRSPGRAARASSASFSSSRSYAQAPQREAQAPQRERPVQSSPPPVHYERQEAQRPAPAPSREQASQSFDRGSYDRSPPPARPASAQAEAGAPSRSGPSVRYYDSARSPSLPSSDRQARGSVATGTRADRGSSSEASTDERGQGSQIRQLEPTTDLIDLSGAARSQRVRVPAIYGSSSGERSGPASARTSALGARRDFAASQTSNRVHIPAQPVTRESILERYRPAAQPSASTPPEGSAPEGPASERGHSRDLSQLRGADTDASRARNRSIASGASGASAAALARREKIPTARSLKSPAERRANQERQNLNRLHELSKSHPAKARALLNQGEAIATATSTSLHLGVAVGFGLTGCHNGDGFWDPNFGGWGCWGPWYAWCGPGSWWWWGSCSYWWPWCPSFGFGYWYNHFGFYWSGSPYWCYPHYAYWSPAPAYYSYVVYDNAYDPPPAQVVIYDSSAPADQEPAAGEASIEVAPPATGSSPGPSAHSEALGRAASHYLTLGDRAFREGRYSDAVHFYANAVEFSPDDGVLYLILSDALFATGDYHYAAYGLRRALDLDPHLVDSVVDKHGFYTDPAEFDRQLRLLERYVEDHFLDDDARLVLAANYLFADRPAQAVDLLESAFSLEVRQSNAGRVLLDRAKDLAQASAK